MNQGLKDKFRMAQWLLLSLVAYGLAAALAGIPGEGVDAGMFPRLQTVLWKCGHLNLAAFIGYWIDRRAFRDSRLFASSPPLLHIRRAVIIVGTMIAYGLAL